MGYMNKNDKLPIYFRSTYFITNYPHISVLLIITTNQFELSGNTLKDYSTKQEYFRIHYTFFHVHGHLFTM